MKMTKLRTLVGAAAIFLAGSTTSLMAASFGGGVTGGVAYLEVNGDEKLHPGNGDAPGEERSGTAGGAGAMPSVFLQGQFFGGWTLGYEMVLGSVTLESERRDNISADAGVTPIKNTVKVAFKDLRNIYLETPGITPLGLYLKTGYSEMDVDNQSDLDTGAVYADTTADAFIYGFGFKKGDPDGGWQTKLEFAYTDWDTISVTSTADAQGNNVVSAEPMMGTV